MSNTSALLLTIFFTLSHLASSLGLGRTFRFPLIHGFRPDASVSNLWTSARDRSIVRCNRIRSIMSPNSLSLNSSTTWQSFEYFMRMTVGTPPFNFEAVIDTGSDLIWTLCLPCTTCDALGGHTFEPFISLTYTALDCGSAECKDFGNQSTTCGDDHACAYTRAYMDATNTSGVLSKDVFTMTAANGSTVSVPDVTFGCGDGDGGSGSGLVGLSKGKYSLINQLGSVVARKFSYCFTPSWSKKASDGHLIIGEGAMLLGNSTPMIAPPKESATELYFVELEDISINGGKLHLTTGLLSAGIIDSGSAFTELPSTAYSMLVEKLRHDISLEAVAERNVSELCFIGGAQDLVGKNIPNIIFHFSGGLNVPIEPRNAFVERIEEGEKMVCLTMMPSDNDYFVIGNFAQQNMNVGFDLEKSMVTFAPAVCSTL